MWGTLSLRLTVVPIVLLAALLVRPSTDAAASACLPLLIATGLFDTGANLLYGASARHGLISVVSVLGSLYPVVLVALAYFVLHERIARPQLAGVAARARRRRAHIGRRLTSRLERAARHARSISSRIGRTCWSGRFFGSVKTQLIRRTPGVTGQTSSLHVEIAMSAQARSSASSLCGTWSLASMPISASASTTSGCGAVPGSLPALRALCRSPAARRNRYSRHHRAAGVADADEEDVHALLRRRARRARTGRRSRRATRRGSVRRCRARARGGSRRRAPGRSSGPGSSRRRRSARRTSRRARPCRRWRLPPLRPRHACRSRRRGSRTSRRRSGRSPRGTTGPESRTASVAPTSAMLPSEPRSSAAATSAPSN